MTGASKGEIAIDWGDIFSLAVAELNTAQKWGYATTNGYNNQACNIIMHFCNKKTFIPATLESSALTSVQTIITNSASYLGTHACCLNIPSLYPALDVMLGGGDPCTPSDLFGLSVGKVNLGLTIGTLPTSSAMWSNWPPTTSAPPANWLATGYSARYGRINRDGTVNSQSFAQNQMLFFAANCLFAAEVQGDTSFYATAEAILYYYMVKFPTLTVEKAEAYYETGSITYRTVKSVCLLALISKLKELGSLTDSEVATYLTWIEPRVTENETDVYTNHDCWPDILAIEMMYAQLKGSRTIPRTYGIGSLKSIVDEVNHTALINTAFPFLWYAYNSWTCSTHPAMRALISAFER